jgi:4-amino-4-deoxy-L-arabinose transferase-like glycosyltransferase
MTGVHRRRFHLWILFVVLLAFSLRLYAIDRQDIWGDEAFSIWLSSQPLPEVVAGGADTHPPLYPFLLYLWMRLSGSSALAVRLLSAAIGTLTVPVVYALGRRAFGQAAGFVAALLAAVSPALVYYAQETRMYVLVTLLAAASVYWTLRVFREPRSIGAWLAYLLATLAAAYTHYYAFFVVLAENLVVVLSLLRRRRWPDLGRWLAAQGILVLAYLPWIAVQTGFLSGKASARFEEWDLTTAGRIAGETLAAFAAGLAVPSLTSWLVAALFLIAIAAGVAALFRRREPEPWLIGAYLLLPLFLAWAINPIMPFFYARYLLLIAPAFCILAAWGVMVWGHLWRPLSTVGLAILLAGSGYGLHGYYTDEAYVRGRYGQMMSYVQANAQPGDGLILANQLQRPIFEYYQPEGLQAYFFPRYEYPLEDPRSAEDLEAIAARHPRLWLVRFGNPAEYDPAGFLVRWLATHGSKAYFDGWADADLSLYVMAPAATAEGIQHPQRADLGDQVRLLGYALSAEEVAPGETLLLTLYWQALAPMEESYTVFTHLLDADQQIQAQMDSEPQGGSLPTNRWTVGQIVPDNYALTVAAGASAGPHVLEVGMYLLGTLQRLPVRDPDTGASLGDRVLLGTVQVVEK